MINIKFLEFCKILMISFIAISCARPSSDKTSNIKLSLEALKNSQQVQSMSLELAHIVINVSGPGIDNQIVLNWDADKPNNSCSISDCTLIIPSGKQRFIQLLGVYKDTTSESMSFYYGDTVNPIDLMKTDESISIEISSINTNISAKEINFAGRFLSEPTGGPTGILELRFKPGANKQSMLIESTEIFNGWFRTFGIIGVNFEYVFNNILLTDTTQPIEKLFDPANPSQLIIEWPESYRQNGSNTSTPIYVKEKPRTDFFGFFGKYASLGHVCYSGTTANFDWAFTDATGTNKLSYNPDNISPSHVYINHTATNDCIGVSSTNPVTSFGLYIDPVMHNFEFSGPFIKGANGDFISGNSTSGTLINIKWNFLPDIQSQISGSSIFIVKDGLIDNYRSKGPGDGYDCETIKKLADSDDANVIFAGTTKTNDFSFNPIELNLSETLAPIVCATNGDQTYKTGIGIRPKNNNTTGGTSSGPTNGTGGCITNCGTSNTGSGLPPTKIHIESRNEPLNSIGLNKCVRIALDLRDANNNVTSATTDMAFTIKANGSTSLPVYNGNDWSTCDMDTSGSYALTNTHFISNSSMPIEFLVKNTFGDGITFTIGAINSRVSNDNISFTSLGSTFTYIQADISNSILTQMCYSVTLKQKSIINWSDVTDSTSRSISFTGTSSALSVFDSYTNCAASATPISTTLIPANGSSSTVFLKLSSSISTNNGPLNFVLSAPGLSNIITNTKNVWLGNGFNTPSQIRINGPFDLGLNSCNKLDLELQNDNFTAVTSSSVGISGFNFNFSPNTSAQFFNSYTDCTNNINTITFPTNLPGNQNRYEIWIKPNTITSGSLNDTLSFTANSPVISIPSNTMNTFNFRVNSPPDVNGYTLQGYNRMSVGLCNELDLKLQNSNMNSGNIINTSNRVIENINLNNSSTLISSSLTDCQGNISTGSIVIPANSLSTKLYIKPTATDVGSTTLNSTSNSFGTTIISNLNLNIGTMGQISSQIFTNGNQYEKFSINDCREFTIYLTDMNNYPSVIDGQGSTSSTKTINLSFSNLTESASLNPNVNFFTNCNSTTPISSDVIPSGNYKYSFVVKSSTTIPLNDFKIKIDTHVNGATLTPITKIINPTPLAHHLQMTNTFTGGTITNGLTCMRIEIQGQDSANAPITMPSLAILPFEIYAHEKGEFFISTDCSGNGQRYIHSEINGNTNLTALYFKPISSGSFTPTDFDIKAYDFVNSDISNLKTGFLFDVTSASLNLGGGLVAPMFGP